MVNKLYICRENIYYGDLSNRNIYSNWNSVNSSVLETEVKIECYFSHLVRRDGNRMGVDLFQ